MYVTSYFAKVDLLLLGTVGEGLVGFSRDANKRPLIQYDVGSRGLDPGQPTGLMGLIEWEGEEVRGDDIPGKSVSSV